jgi:hypothetical protein
MRSEQGTVYHLSKTLTVACMADGTLILQRNMREPVVVSSAEVRNLRAALDETKPDG